MLFQHDTHGLCSILCFSWYFQAERDLLYQLMVDFFDVNFHPSVKRMEKWSNMLNCGDNPWLMDNCGYLKKRIFQSDQRE